MHGLGSGGEFFKVDTVWLTIHRTVFFVATPGFRQLTEMLVWRHQARV